MTFSGECNDTDIGSKTKSCFTGRWLPNVLLDVNQDIVDF